MVIERKEAEFAIGIWSEFIHFSNERDENILQIHMCFTCVSKLCFNTGLAMKKQSWNYQINLCVCFSIINN